MSRLGPARAFSQAAVGASLAWFPGMGLGLGLVQAGLFLVWDLSALGAAQGWLYTALGWWATRGLHWDGLADIADAWGSGARGERFWEICKDSRVGAFGVMGVVLGMGLMAALAGACLDRGLGVALLLAPMLGRSMIVALACVARPLARPGLGGTFLREATAARLAWVLGWTILLWLGVAGMQAWTVLLLALALAAVPCWRLLALGRAQGGLNGDFLGSAALLSELAVLAAWLLAA
ncbi:adenosylcobinamide-GDP ribazoletransferase [Megalodesulfovibrio gigas]|uniref:Adenosylcobinamide-GDP ribazoletransferase n=1 Tax=Megalodesulfovibrio gigas (strain ATCC 19364 / DSM 1382 / NCIMB 9332 / VKM B-1759) TaxID=1121448 RepID=T2GBQ0_MEGG1|nr:adenosylcobinamide-GDP ribazoletransferase [Megalodesulfovibrio gigas]AGW13347.1 putative cobalamin-5-phosphate synthase CobS [Megalodesulfovibrio gigas DSM 1382 = ATCC 19364]